MHTADTPSIPERSGWSRARSILGRIVLFLISISVFIFSLMVMKAGAGPLAPWIRSSLSVDSPASALGFGWLSANVALSGSPVAATALTFLDAHVLSVQETFAMIAGSRLGAAMLVLLVGFIYVLRGKQRDLSLNVGLLSLLVTQTIYPAVLFIGFYLLSNGWFDSWQINAAHGVQTPLQMFFDPFILGLQHALPEWAILPIGFLLVLFSLWLFDRTIPNIHLRESGAGMVQHLLYRPVVTFFIGAAITVLTMSVSVSLGLLVPLSVRGYVRRENLIPYILGANITTFIDTLIAAALLANPTAVTVVLIQMVSVGIVSLVILVTSYRFYQHFVERMAELIGRRQLSLVIYVGVIIVVPFLLVIFG
jgi:sodium-dependent phosphate cotransporter